MNAHVHTCHRCLPGMLALILMLTGALAGCGADVDDLRTEGIQQFRNHQYIESTATLRYVLELQPNDPEANYYMGLNYRAMATRKYRENDIQAANRELDTSILYFTQAIKSWPNYMAAISSKNEALEARGKYQLALALAEDVTHNNRGDATEHFIYLGNEYRERGDYDNALRAYKIALAGEPNSARAYAEMGKLYERIGDTALAQDSYRRAFELGDTGVGDSLEELHRDSGIRTAADEPQP